MTQSSVFEPLRNASVVDEIVHQIETLIVNGILRDGGRLPSERDLAEQMKVSRPKVREALKVLESNDLITIKHGDGAFIAPLIGAAMSPALIELYSRHQAAFEAYLEFRLVQECFASRLAATRATKADKEILGRLKDRLITAHEDGDAHASEVADTAFHAAVVDASHNSLLVHTMTSIYALTKQNLFYNRAFLRSIDGTGELILSQHVEICEAISIADPERAEDAARAHIEFVQKSYQEEQSRGRRDMIAHRRLAMMSGD